jgi:hypothetical protein
MNDNKRITRGKRSLHKILEDIGPFLPKVVKPKTPPLREWHIEADRVRIERQQEREKCAIGPTDLTR